jgi:molecular chaperone DnaK
MKAVAFGAALHAHQLTGEAEMFDIPPEFRGVTGYNIGIQTLDVRTNKISIDTLIRKNLPLPIRASRTYFTSSAEQTKIKLQLVQFRETGDAVIPIGEMLIGPLPNPQLNYPVEVSVECTPDGLVRVEAFDPNTGVELEQVFGENSADGTGNLVKQKSLVQQVFINNI